VTGFSEVMMPQSRAFPHPNLHVTGVGGGLVRTAEGLRFLNPPGDGRGYCNAQLDDYQGLARRSFLWRPPLRLRVSARFSHPAGELLGTAGFGFWNDPFGMTGRRVPALPAACWFFYASPPSDMALAQGVPGAGWKAATLDARTAGAAVHLPLLALAAPLLRRRRFYARIWPRIQRALRIAEAPLALDMTTWHNYELRWDLTAVHFRVDGRTVLMAPAPAGPLGLVVWLDNQWLVARPEGALRGGVLARRETQRLEIREWELG
jgi:hypothetical protein